MEDSDDLDTFQPHIIHAPHKPFPIAMTSRKPHGSKSLCHNTFTILMPSHVVQCPVTTVRLQLSDTISLLLNSTRADIRNPQNAAWLAACRYAKHKIWMYDRLLRHDDITRLITNCFRQTPTLNARPIKRAIKQACRRGVEVILFLDLGQSFSSGFKT